MFNQTQQNKSSNEESNYFIERAKKQDEQAKIQRGAGVFAGLVGATQNLNIGLASSRFYKAQASEVELNAVQQANQLRQQFLGEVGNYAFTAGQRGVSVKSGNVQSNLTESSANLGKDIAEIDRSAASQSKALMAQGKIARARARSQFVVDVASSFA